MSTQAAYVYVLGWADEDGFKTGISTLDRSYLPRLLEELYGDVSPAGVKEWPPHHVGEDYRADRSQKNTEALRQDHVALEKLLERSDEELSTDAFRQDRGLSEGGASLIVFRLYGASRATSSNLT